MWQQYVWAQVHAHAASRTKQRRTEHAASVAIAPMPVARNYCCLSVCLFFVPLAGKYFSLSQFCVRLHCSRQHSRHKEGQRGTGAKKHTIGENQITLSEAHAETNERVGV